MKKIVNVNIGGVPFTLDEDAFRMLEQYLNTLKAIYHDEDEDMVADIEARIAELLLMNVPEGRIVTLTDVSREIAIIGDPKDFDDEDNLIEESINVESPSGQSIDPSVETHTFEGGSATVPPVFNQNPPQIQHKLYRDPRNKMIAGVCSGIAAYNHMSVNTVRILTVAAFFITMIFPLGAALSIWIVPIVYACFWIAVPEAHTPLQYMQLYGESGSMADVAKAVNNQYATPQTYPPYPESTSGFWTTVANIIIAIVKGFFAFCAIVIGVPLIIGIIIIALVLIFAGIAWGCSAISQNDMSVWFPQLADMIQNLPGGYGWVLTAVIAALGALLIPSWFLIRSVFHLESRFPLTRTSRIIWLIIWILSILIGITAGMHLG